MNALAQACTAVPAGVAQTTTPKDLTAFLDPSCAAAVWTREIPPPVLTGLATRHLETLPSARLKLRPEDAI